MDEAPQTREAYVRLNTDLLRSSDAPEYARLREVLRDHGVDPARAILADYFDDGGAYFGVVLTPSGQFVELDIFYIYEPEQWLAGEPVRWQGRVRWDPVSDLHELLAEDDRTAATALLDTGY